MGEGDAPTDPRRSLPLAGQNVIEGALAVLHPAGRETAQADKALELAGKLVEIPNAGGRYSTKILPDPDAVFAVKEALGKAIEATR